MGKFKIGDRVRCMRDYIDLTVGKVYTVSEIGFGGRVCVVDDVGDMNYCGEYELADDVGAIDWTAALEVFDPKHGVHALDPVRPNPNCNKFWPFVAYCPTMEQDFYINKELCEVNNGMSQGNWAIRNASDTDELAELRAFRDAAIAKYPDLAPVDPDEAAVQRFAKMYWDDELSGVDEAVRAAIRWARANPR